MATNSAFAAMPEEVWRWYLYRRTVCRKARPNAAHRAIVELEQGLGDRFRLVTQNVDGLHLRAGSTPDRTYQIHGNIDYMRCTSGCCTDLHPIPDAIPPKERGDALLPAEFELLRCPACGGGSRPHVLWFDEYYDEELFRFESTHRAASEADLLVVVGTSGATNLPLQCAQVARQRGAAMIDVNPEDNVFGEFAASLPHGHTIRDSAAEAVPELVDRMLS
jgi:NAD-dependent deacetylase